MAKVNQSDRTEVVATRDGKQRTFTIQTWNLLGPNKNGWSEVKADPKELKETKTTEGAKTQTKKAEKAPIVKKLTVAQQKKADAETKTTEGANATNESGLSPEDLAAQNLGGAE